MAIGLEIKQKRTIHPVKWLVVLFAIASVVFVAYYGFRWFMTGETLPFSIAKAANIGVPNVDTTDVTVGQVQAYTVSSTAPRYISIPSIGLDQTRIQGVGLTKNNVLDVPENIHDAGWYTKSAYPGSGYGAALLTAHSVGHEVDGAFKGLGGLSLGSVINIQRGDGKTFAYKVVSNETMALEDAIPNGMRKMMLSADSTKEGLNLMTFAGNYIPRIGQFEKRVMVRAIIAN